MGEHGRVHFLMTRCRQSVRNRFDPVYTAHKATRISIDQPVRGWSRALGPIVTVRHRRVHRALVKRPQSRRGAPSSRNVTSKGRRKSSGRSARVDCQNCIRFYGPLRSSARVPPPPPRKRRDDLIATVRRVEVLSGERVQRLRESCNSSSALGSRSGTRVGRGESPTKPSLRTFLALRPPFRLPPSLRKSRFDLSIRRP